MTLDPDTEIVVTRDGVPLHEALRAEAEELEAKARKVSKLYTSVLGTGLFLWFLYGVTITGWGGNFDWTPLLYGAITGIFLVPLMRMAEWNGEADGLKRGSFDAYTLQKTVEFQHHIRDEETLEEIKQAFEGASDDSVHVLIDELNGLQLIEREEPHE